MAMGMLKIALALALVAGAANAQLIYTVYNSDVNKTFFEINTTDPLQLESYVDMLAPPPGVNVPQQCIGYDALAEELNAFSPNGLAFDGGLRLYFVAWDQGQRTQARLCVLNMNRPNFFYKGELPTFGVTAAGFDQGLYVFLYLENGSPLAGDVVYLNPVTGNVISQIEINQWVDRTTDPNNNVPSSINVFYRGGDLALDCDRNLYASSVGTNGAESLFFRLNELPSGGVFSYTLLATGPNNDAPQQFAVNSQLAYTDSGILIAHNTPTGKTTIVSDETTGQTGYLGQEGEIDGYIIYRQNGVPIGFSDMASRIDCVTEFCVVSQSFSECEGAFIDVYTKSELGTIPCKVTDDRCLQPPACTQEFDCTYYIPIDGRDF